jgi:hypothetical protein
MAAQFPERPLALPRRAMPGLAWPRRALPRLAAFIRRKAAAWTGFPGCGINRREEMREHRRRKGPLEV